MFPISIQFHPVWLWREPPSDSFRQELESLVEVPGPGVIVGEAGQQLSPCRGRVLTRLTFTELQSRVSRVVIATYHSTALKIVAEDRNTQCGPIRGKRGVFSRALCL